MIINVSIVLESGQNKMCTIKEAAFSLKTRALQEKQQHASKEISNTYLEQSLHISSGEQGSS